MVAGSIPGARKPLFRDLLGMSLYAFLHMLGQVWGTFGGSLLVGWGHFWSGWGHFLVEFGMSWDVSGSGQGTFSDGFGMVLEKMSDEVRRGRKNEIFKNG